MHHSTTPTLEGKPTVPFDAELAAALTVINEYQPPGSLSAETLPRMRQGHPAMPDPTLEDLSLDGAYLVEDRQVPGPPNAPDISLLICRPAAASGPVPVIYHTHGGGMVLGTNRVGVLDLLHQVRDLNTAVVSVEYRLAPEIPHPGPVEDCYAGLVWTARHAEDLGVDETRVVVAGASAGGGLAAAVTLMARDRGGPALLGQMLMIPMLDDRNDTPSAVQMAGRGVWDRQDNRFGWSALLGDAAGGPDVSPYAAPARATDLSGLPPAFIDVGSAETFRDEAVAYASRIWQAGGQAELHVWPGGFHGFFGAVPQAAVSQAAVAAQHDWLRRTLGGAAST
ncbi:alpha/beta hydrolase fold domain-containing protein [Streptomyces sp. NPDC004539]|uniref:alpha/beta hydrolase fold domain-containing protein n=1 Tax=Streptomyces sp. NPDC004539 TaxID=3154280 RepID=UPI0033ABF0B5